jgi:uncharacterized protein with GYD domain
MPTYIGLVEYTQQAITEFESHPERVAEAREAIESLGGELTKYYNTLGQYDAVAVAEFPDGDTAMANSIIQAKQGTVRIETLRAFDEDETQAIIEGLPD